MLCIHAVSPARFSVATELHSVCRVYIVSFRGRVDTYYLIKWLEEDEDLYDVIAAKDVVPPEDCDILDVTPGMICRIMFNSKFYAAKVVTSGSYIYI